MERENELRQMREQNERERMEIYQEFAGLRNQLSRASLTPQVNKMIKERDQRIELLSPTRSLQVN